jgi:peptidoglycan/LPS O-acetylase OafA/YrhL
MTADKPTQDAPSSSRLQELDALRGIAATMVMWFHYTVQYQEFFGPTQVMRFALPPGRYGVQLFFVISGFVIFLTLSHSRSLWDFAANRLCRLYPPYWASLAITFVIIHSFPLPGFEVTLWQAVVNLTMLQYWLFTPHLDPVYWTLSVELAFYGFVSVLFSVGWLARVERWVAVWLGMEIIVRGADLANLFHISPMIRTALLLDHGHFFFAGVLFYRMKQEGFTTIRWLLLATCILAAWLIRDVPHALSLVVATLVFVAFLRGKLGWLKLRPLLFLGNISYPLYLLHQDIGYVIISQLRKAGFVSEAWLLVPVLVALLLATAVHRLVEKPGRDWLRAQWKRSSLRTRLVPDSVKEMRA